MDFSFDWKETHLRVSADRLDESRVLEHLSSIYGELERYIEKNVFFASSIEPVDVDDGAPEIARQLSRASALAGVGPMAAVAGAFAQKIGEFILSEGATEVVVENGGDVYLKLAKEKTVGLHAGEGSPLNKLAFKLSPAETPCGVCTSSATQGHSISFGEADGVTVVADSALIADAAATAVANEVRGRDAVKTGLRKAKSIPKIRGAVIIKDGELAAWGNLPEIIKV